MADIKLKNRNGVETTYLGVTSIIIKDTNNNNVEFSQSPMSDVYMINFEDNESVIRTIYIPQGQSLTFSPFTLTKTGYMFLGWGTGTTVSTLISYPYTPTGNVTLYAVWQAGAKCIVSGLGSSSPSSVTFNRDGSFPYRAQDFEEVTQNGDIFIKIPTMYRKVNSISDNQITSFTIATAKIDDDYEPYPVFLDENGGILPYVLIGKYWNTNSSSMVSTTTGAGVSMTIGNARSYARGRGTGYQQWDWMFQRLWQDLMICAKQTINTNTGAAWTTDNLGIYWGTLSTWVDGITKNDTTWCVSYKPSQYINNATGTTTGYTSLSYSAPSINDQEISKLGYDSSNKFANYPSTVVSESSYSTYYCDYFRYFLGNRPVRSTVGYNAAEHGVFACATDESWSSTRLGRLCYRPL